MIFQAMGRGNVQDAQNGGRWLSVSNCVHSSYWEVAQDGGSVNMDDIGPNAKQTAPGLSANKIEKKVE